MFIENRKLNTENFPGRGEGFTLIEIMVVVFLIVLTVGVVAINFRHDEAQLVETEARRFGALVDQMCQESVVRGDVRAVVSNSPDSYEFLVLGEDGWQLLVGDDIFRARKLKQDVQVRISVDEPGKSSGRLRCDPDGFMTPFSAIFERGETGFRVSANEVQEMEIKPAR